MAIFNIKKNNDNLYVNHLNSVNDYIKQNILTYLRQYLPTGRLEGNEYVCGGFDGSVGNSLRINIRTCLGGDFATGQMVKFPIQIIMYVTNKRQNEIVEMFLKNELQTYTSNINYNKTEQTDIEQQKIKQYKLNETLANLTTITRDSVVAKYLKNRCINKIDHNIFKMKCDLYGYSLISIGKNRQSAQKILLGENGQKRYWNHIAKFSYGNLAGNPIIIPNKKNDIIYITEGVEDGLSVYNNCDYEVWCALGLTNYKTLPLTKDKTYIFLQDNDGENNVSTLFFNNLFKIYKEKCFNVKKIMTENVKDVNELLCKQGEISVRNFLKNI